MIQLKQAVPRLPEFEFQSPLNWTLAQGQHWAVVGQNGAGKSVFVDILTRKIAMKLGTLEIDSSAAWDAVKLMSFRDIYDAADYKNMYYQQRWNSSEVDQSPLVRELIKTWDNQTYLYHLLSLFQATDFLDKQLILLSSGELRKFLIIKALLAKPSVLILDNPYIGLDIASRKLLNELMNDMLQLESLQIMLVLSNPDEIPSFMTHVLSFQNMKLKRASSLKAFLEDKNLQQELFPQNLFLQKFPTVADTTQPYTYAVKMESVNIRYGARTILKNLSWEIKRGEKWALLGPNGAGKSTLLSLICGDNPQAYANNFYLFDRKRGTGESIWDIKKQIGYISPELHLYYLQDVPTIQVVASGFFDSIGLFGRYTTEQEETASQWLGVFGIEQLKNRSFLNLSYGEQRLVLLARAFVKSPDLMILDEPLHGLDKSNKEMVKDIIERYCHNPGKTLIYVTHYPEEIPSCVDKQLLLDKQA